MSRRHTLLLKLRSLVRRAQADDDLDEELRDHVDLKTEQYIEAGLSRTEARRRALLDMGGLEPTKERCRDARRTRWLHDAVQDWRYAARTLRRSPGFALVAVLTLALGIGANAAIFSIVDAVLLRPLAYPAPDRLVLVFDVPQKQPNALAALSDRDFTEYRDHNDVFSDLAGNAFHDLTVTGAGEPFIVNTGAVTPGLFSLLGATPLAGRTLLPADGQPAAAPVAVVSEALWRGRYGSNAALIGQSITLDMRPFTVVGVVPDSFRYPDGAARQDVWIPIAQDPLFGPLLLRPGTRVMSGIGRLAPGVSLADAQADMTMLAARLARRFPADDAGFTIRVEPYRQAVVGNVRSALLMLLGAVGLVLLIACANIANLLLSRASSRQTELAMRMALGASRARIVRQLLTESALLGSLGAAGGIALAAALVGSLRPFVPPDIVRINTIHVGGPVLIFALVLSVGAVLAFGLGPALLGTSSTVRANINDGGERAGQRGRQIAKNVLAVMEVSLATGLLIASGLFIRSLALVTSSSPGFDPDRVVEAEVSLPRFLYSTPAQWAAFANDLLTRLRAQPGFEDSALGAPLPMDRQGAATFPFTIVGAPAVPASQTPTADYATVSPDYFRVMRIPLMKGRLFSEQDMSSSRRVAIISETLARRYFIDQDPIGKQMKFGFPPNVDVSREVVGLVGDVRDVALSRTPGPMMYVPFAQAPLWGGEVVVRSSLSASDVAAGVRHAVYAIDKNLPVTEVAPLSDMVDQSVAQERFRAFLLGAFGALALILAGVGIFGVISYLVSQRTREIGVRMALGAGRTDILRMMLGQGARLALVGVVIGLAAAAALTRLMADLLDGVSPTDPLTFGAVAVMLLGVAVMASVVPAIRAIRVDPMTALRSE